VQFDHTRQIETAIASLPNDGSHRLPRICVHGLRHTAATLMLANAKYPQVVHVRLGHSDISMMPGRCSHVSVDMQREATDRLERRLGS
jgi:integrase